jgi:carbamoyl-phosphate synthase small subunit
MSQTKKIKATLHLQDGSLFEGFLFGHAASTAGEVVFQTGMTGYPEAMTDPSYFGQILTCTYPLIGNYGIPSQEKSAEGFFKYFESGRIQPKAIIVADYSFKYNHWQAEQSLEQWMKRHKVPGIYGIDTRQLTKKLREKGTMLGKVSIGLKDSEFYDPNKIDILPEVTCKEAIEYGKDSPRILLLDCGAKEGIVRSLLQRKASVVRVPYDADITKYEYDGILVSNGPGDPKKAGKAISTLRAALKGSKPIFGICLGSQLLGLAAGADTHKLKYGHRSQNQPCQNTETKKCYITSQNHGFAIREESLQKDWNVWFRNLNDTTVEGIKHRTEPFFSVQFHPEASPGPTDAGFLFDEFLAVCKKQK